MGLTERIKNRPTYLDSNIFIYFIERRSGYYEALNPIMRQIDAGELFATTSELTLAEMLVGPLRKGNVLIETTTLHQY